MAEGKLPERRPSDNLCKFLAEQYPAQFIEWLFGARVTDIHILKTELQREPIRADAALLVESGETVYHIEFQTTAHSEVPLPLRMLDYYVGFKRQFPAKTVRQVLVVLKDSGVNVPEVYQDEAALLRYNVVRLWEQDPDELMRYGGLLPLATLCRPKGKPAQLLQAVAEQIEAVSSPAERRERISLAQVLAGLRYAHKLVYRILREAEMLEESTIYQDILQRGVQRGVAQGIAQGEQNMVLRQLTRRFGRLDVRLEQRVTELSLERLEDLGEALLELRDLDELRAWLRKRKR